MRNLAFLLLLAGTSMQAAAARRVTVAELEQDLTALHGKSDAEAARDLSDLDLTERLSTATLTHMSAPVGPAVRQELILLADLSALLTLPADEVPSTPAPEFALQQAMMARAIDYVGKTLHQLPNLYATRTTSHFEDIPQGFDSTNTYSYYQPLRLVGTTTTTVVYRDGAEVQDQGPRKTSGSAQPPAGLVTSGEFGPILSTVLVDAAKGKLYWGHWEQGANGPLAVFSYSVPLDQSHYKVSYCCVVEVTGRRVVHLTPGYHGELTIDPATGVVYRVTVQADLKPGERLAISSIVVEYGPVEIGGKSYICPVKGIAISLGAGIGLHSPQIIDFREANLNKQTPGSPGPMQTTLNESVFEQYHLFRADTRLVLSPGSTP
jgi:hypothetical protein